MILLVVGSVASSLVLESKPFQNSPTPLFRPPLSLLDQSATVCGHRIIPRSNKGSVFRVSDMRSNQPPKCEDLPVVLPDPDIEKQVSPLTLPNGVVSEPPKPTATATATASRRVLNFCWAYLILLLCLLVFGVVASSISIPVLQFFIIYGVLVVIALGTALGLSVSCGYAMEAVERANKNAKNVPLGNPSGV